ncbi:McrBC 5-methylcytosine restriction system component [Streptococcus pneumoniae]|nr:McrBC 5-methylcytosine restriction system component [Streptococcus pneumoniae]
MGLFFYTKIGSIISIVDLPTTNIIEPILKAEKAGLVFPSKDKVIDNEIGNLAGYGALLKKWSIQIPQKSSSYSAFCKMMENSEENFKAIIDEEVGRK